MTTDRTLHCSDLIRLLVDGILPRAVLVCLLSSTSVFGQDKPVHWRHNGAMPPGAIGRQRLARGGPLSGVCQPVEIRAPAGVRIAPAAGSNLGGSGFAEGSRDVLLVGLAIGPVYRFRVTEIPEHEGVELFPTVEVIDRLYPPPGLQTRFPIPIELTAEELLLASEGRFITRVIYLEDPKLAPAIARDAEEQPWVEARPGEDPLVMADQLGRPVAILRMGGRVPEENQTGHAEFLYGAPPVTIFDRSPKERSKNIWQDAQQSPTPSP